MSDQLHDRVADLLSAAEAASTAAVSPADESAPSITETATEANELVASTDPQELLAAVGFDRGSETDSPGTIPEAIAHGDRQQVDDLKRLLNLASLGDRGDEPTLDAATDRLQTAVETTNESRSADADETDESAETEDTGEEDETEKTGESDKPDSELGDEIGEQLRSAVTDRVEAFSDDVSSIQEQLGSIAHAAGDDDETTADETEEGDKTTGSEDDDGLFDTDQEDDQLGSIGSSDSSRHSTMAPSPSDRADMHALKRHSTMPKKN